MTCKPTFEIENSLSFQPHGHPSKTGDLFSLECREGFTPTAANGSVICNEKQQWQNEPKCIGKISY